MKNLKEKYEEECKKNLRERLKLSKDESIKYSCSIPLDKEKLKADKDVR